MKSAQLLLALGKDGPRTTRRWAVQLAHLGLGLVLRLGHASPSRFCSASFTMESAIFWAVRRVARMESSVAR